MNLLGSGQHPLGLGQFLTAEIRINSNGIDAPFGNDMAPQGNFGGIIAFILIFQAQLAQSLGGVAIGYNAHDFGIGCPFTDNVLNAFARANLLRYTRRFGVNAISWNFFAVVNVIDVIQRLYFAVDRQTGQRMTAIEDIGFFQRFIFRVGSANKQGQHA